MNSLEFINQNICDCKNHIEYLENKIIEDKIYPGFVKSHLERIEELKPILKHLEQIKTKLEAWEVVKDKITTIGYYDTQEDFEEDTNEHKALCFVRNLKFQNSNDEDEWFIPLTNEENKTLKKALEVK